MTYDHKLFVSLDLETYLIEPGILAPPIVCGSTARVIGDIVVGELLGRVHALSHARALLTDGSIIVGANIAYDFGCLARADASLVPLIFKAYEEHRVFDVQIAQALHAIAEGNLYLDPRTGEPLRSDSGRRGRYSLKKCVEFVLGREDAKVHDRWRKCYALLEGTPIEEWPADARQYPVDDAVNTLEAALAQVGHPVGLEKGCTPGPHRNIEDLPNQVEAHWAMHLGAMWGLRTDGDRVAALSRRVEAAHKTFLERFKDVGFFRDDGSKDTAAVKRAVVMAYCSGDKCPAPDCVGGKSLSVKTGNPINCRHCSGTGLDIRTAPRTPTGGVKADRDALVESGDPDLEAFGESEAEKVRTSYLPFLIQGITRPITLSPNILVASGRTSYDGMIQLLPHGNVAGDIASSVRPCFRARRGYVYCSVDYGALELCTFSQVCLWLLGRSQMAETINATGDPSALHTAFAAKLAGKSTEDMVLLVDTGDDNAKAHRQVAKFCNFALLGGMGAAKFCLLARKRSSGETVLPNGTKMPGVRFCVLIAGAERCGVEKVTEYKGRTYPPICKKCLEIAADLLRPMWFKQWTEVNPFFNWVKSRVGDEGMTAEMPCLATERVRGNCGFTDGANNMFQALASDGAKHALRMLTRECYLDRGSVLWGTRPIMFIHDEIVAEIPEARASLAGDRMSRVMIDAMREYVPDVTIKADPALARFWDKQMKTVRDERGQLQIWTPKEMAA
jgi:DNA polymerase-1